MSARILPFPGSNPPKPQADLLGGLYSLPLEIESEPETVWLALIWTDDDGFVLDHDLIREEEVEAAIDRGGQGTELLARSFEKACESYSRRKRDAPQSVALNGDTLASMMGSIECELKVLESDCGPVDLAAEALQEHLLGPNLDTWFAGGVDGATLSSYFEAMTYFRTMRPWETIPPGGELMNIQAPTLELPDGVVWVFARDSEDVTLQIFDSFLDWRLHARLSLEVALDPEEEMPELPPCLRVGHLSATESPPELYAEAVKHQWIQAGDPLPLPLRIVGPMHIRLPLPHEYDLLAITSSGIATFAERVLRKSSPMGTQTQGMLVEEELPRGQTEIDLGSPAGELYGCTDGGHLGFGPTIAELVNAYLEERRTEVGPATLRRDETVLRGHLEFIDWEFLNLVALPDDGMVHLPSTILGAESIGMHLTSYVISEYLGRSHDSQSDPTLQALRECVTSVRQFLRYLRRTGMILPDMVDQLLEVLLGRGGMLEEALRIYLDLLAILRREEPHAGLELAGPQVSSGLWKIRRLEGDRLWLVNVTPGEDPKPTVTGPVVVKGADLAGVGLARGWGMEGVVGRAKTRGLKRRFGLLTLDRVVPPGLMP